jgi:hypothetical protein
LKHNRCTLFVRPPPRDLLALGGCFVRRQIAVGLLCGGLAACAVPQVMPPASPPLAVGPVGGYDLPSARGVCDQRYPAQIGNYLAHAQCVNAAIERYALASSPSPDLVGLQEQARVQLSQRIDSRVISADDGAAQITAVDRAVDAAERERAAAHPSEADDQVRRIRTIINP